MSTLQLNSKWIERLRNLPEAGMGYQLVRIYLADGKTLSRQKVVNASLLILQGNKNFSVDDIIAIESDKE